MEIVMKRVLLAGIAAVVLSSGVAQAADKVSAKFLPKAIEGNFAEVEMGKLAQSNGQSKDVKSFGKMLVTDHSAANEKAMDVAKSMNVTAPTGPNEKQKTDHDKMAKMKGAEFDKMFAKDMIADHKKDIKEYKSEAKEGDAAGQYAKDSLPTLEKHLQTAQSLEKGR
jgi:putative membrane protein